MARPTPSTKRCGWCCGAWACRWTTWTAWPSVRCRATQQAAIEALVEQRIATRKPAAYLTGEAWLQGVPFHVDERVIVPRSLIAEPLADGALDAVPGRGAAARARPVHRQRQPGGAGGAGLARARRSTPPTCRPTRWRWRGVNVERHALADRIRLRQGDGLAAAEGRYDLILCNPPYVNQAFDGHAARRIPRRARAGAGRRRRRHGLRAHAARATRRRTCSRRALLVLEIGHERAHFEAAFPRCSRCG